MASINDCLIAPASIDNYMMLFNGIHFFIGFI